MFIALNKCSCTVAYVAKRENNITYLSISKEREGVGRIDERHYNKIENDISSSLFYNIDG